MSYIEALQLNEKKPSSLPRIKSPSPDRYYKKKHKNSLKSAELEKDQDAEISFGQTAQNFIVVSLPSLSNTPNLTSRSKSPITVRQKLEFITPSKIRERSRREMYAGDVTPPRNRKLVRVETADFKTELFNFKEIRSGNDRLKTGLNDERTWKSPRHAQCYKHKIFYAVAYCNKCSVDLCVKCSNEHQDHFISNRASKILLKAPSMTDIDPFKNAASLTGDFKAEILVGLAGFSRIDEEPLESAHKRVKNCSECKLNVICPDIYSRKEFDLWKICFKCQNKIFTSPLIQLGTEAITFKDSSSEFSEFSFASAIPTLINGKRWESLKDYITSLRKSPSYDETKDQLIEKAIEERCRQHPRLSQLLISTSGRELMFYDSLEKYWGIGFNGLGSNKLGEILMNIRDRNSF